MGEGWKRARTAALATQQSQPVEVGQVWIDNDSRYKRDLNGPRRLRVVSIDGTHAICAYAVGGGRFRIRLDRFRPTSTGYRLEQ